MQHLHLLARAEVRNPLVSTDRACEFLRRAVALAGMQVIGGPWAVIGTIPGNEGVSATAILDYSSTSIHEWHLVKPWPLVTFDLYTCGQRPEPAVFHALFKEYLDPVVFHARVIDRDAFLL